MNVFSISIFSRWFKTIALTLTGVFFFLCLSSLLLLGTQAGTQYLFAAINASLEADINYQQLQGNLLGTIHIKGFEYQDSAQQLKIANLILTWKPEKLLQNSFHLEQLKLDNILFEKMVQQSSDLGSNDELEQNDVLIDITLPLDIIINEIKLSELHISTNPKDESLLIDTLTVKADIKESKVNLSKLNLKTSGVELTSYGGLKLRDHYPLNINTNLTMKLNHFPHLSSQGVIEGDFNTLRIKQLLGGDLQGDLDFRLRNPLSTLTWVGVANIKQIPVRLLDKTITVKESSFDLSLIGEGDLNSAILKPLKAKLSDGEIFLTGQIDWQPEIHWDLKLETFNINPALAYPQWPGDISLKLTSKGNQSAVANVLNEEKSFQMQLALEHLQGTLLGQPLSGNGRLEMQDDLIQVQHLQLFSGDAHINLDGVIDHQLDFKWQIDIPKLEHLVPDLSGSMLGGGQLSGSRLQPVLAGSVNSAKLKYENAELNQAKLDFSLSTAENYSSHLSLIIDKVISDQNEINDLLLNINGTIKAHSIDFKSQLQKNQLQMNAQGGYYDSESLWRGNIKQLTLRGKLPGTWQLKEIAQLVIHSQNAHLQKLCLFEQKSLICTSAQWQPDLTQASFQAQNISLARIKPLLPDEINELTGEINLDAQMTMRQVIKARLNMELTPGIFSYFFESQDLKYQNKEPLKKVRLKHQNGQITAVLDEKNFTAQWSLNMGKDGIKGDVEIPRTSLEANLDNAPLKGNIKLDIKEMGLLSALIHDIQDVQGFLHADLQLSGVISEPVITGVAEFVLEKITIPMAGVEFNNINFKLKGHANKQLDIRGQIHSGIEKLLIDGNLTLNKEQNWPVKLNFQGKNFQIFNLPELQARISPDVDLEYNMKRVQIKGLIDIPEAGIYLKELPEGAKNVSDDAVVIGEEAEQPANIDLDMSVKLGKNVHLKAFGLDTWLQGRMRVKKSPGQLATANGELRATHGTFQAYGQKLNLEQSRISYAGGFLDDPGLNIRASKEVKDVTVGVMATGTAKNLDVGTYSSDPSLSSKDIVSLLLTGQKLDSAANARVYAGTELTDGLSVGVNVGAGEEGSEFVVRYKLRKNMHLEGISSAKKSGGNVIYTIEIE